LLDANVRDQFKYEIAESLGLLPEIQQKGWGEMTSRDIGKIGGKIGGNMVKVMIRFAEEAMAADDMSPLS
ncbi:MAG: small, acid-soluble spore protein, alpha/beta type, partial [Firmicutes bacterium]|nr:small, acid-soluble spore protein, alpha/beta type [Bacillota bacterium]